MVLRLVKRDDGSESTAVPVEGPQDPAHAALQGRVIHAVYQSVLEVEPWHECMALMGELFRASAIIVVRPSSARDLGYIVNVPANPEVEIAYRSHWYKFDPFLDLPAECPLLVADVMTEQQWRDTPFYRDFLHPAAPTDAQRVLGVNVVTRAGTVSRVRLHRDAGASPFGDADKALLATLVPHIKQAMTLAAHVNRNESERELYEEALDRLHIGVVVLDENGQLLRANPTACHVLGSGDGIRLVDRRLEGCSAADTRELRRLIEAAQAHPGAVMAASLTRPSGRRPVGVVVRGIPLVEESEGRSRPAWAVFLRDPDAPTSAPRDIVQQLFDFTPAESALALELADGLSLDEAAEKLGIRRNTARAHLRSIFSKAGVSRQTELVRVLLNGVIGLSSSER